MASLGMLTGCASSKAVKLQDIAQSYSVTMQQPELSDEQVKEAYLLGLNSGIWPNQDLILRLYSQDENGKAREELKFVPLSYPNSFTSYPNAKTLADILDKDYDVNFTLLDNDTSEKATIPAVWNYGKDPLTGIKIEKINGLNADKYKITVDFNPSQDKADYQMSEQNNRGLADLLKDYGITAAAASALGPQGTLAGITFLTGYKLSDAALDSVFNREHGKDAYNLNINPVAIDDIDDKQHLRQNIAALTYGLQLSYNDDRQGHPTSIQGKNGYELMIVPYENGVGIIQLGPNFEYAEVNYDDNGKPSVTVVAKLGKESFIASLFKDALKAGAGVGAVKAAYPGHSYKKHHNGYESQTTIGGGINSSDGTTSP